MFLVIYCILSCVKSINQIVIIINKKLHYRDYSKYLIHRDISVLVITYVGIMIVIVVYNPSIDGEHY